VKSRTLGAAVLCTAALTVPASPAAALSHAPNTAAGKTAREQVRDARSDRRESGFRASVVAVPAPLAAIAACESGSNPRAIGGGGLYRGKYQFDLATWASVGGSGDPAAASEGEQDMRATILYARAGSAPWPVCG
jgi:hypothetical protein